MPLDGLPDLALLSRAQAAVGRLCQTAEDPEGSTSDSRGPVHGDTLHGTHHLSQSDFAAKQSEGVKQAGAPMGQSFCRVSHLRQNLTADSIPLLHDAFHGRGMSCRGQAMHLIRSVWLCWIRLLITCFEVNRKKPKSLDGSLLHACMCQHI